jgi:hypothetical protein
MRRHRSTPFVVGVLVVRRPVRIAGGNVIAA